MNLDEELKSALKRTEPPPGFAETVMARVEPETQRYEKPRVIFWRTLLSPFGSPLVRLAAGVALLCVISGLFALQIERAKEAAKAEAAKNQLMLALGVASEKINIAQRRVSEIGAPPQPVEREIESNQNRPAERRRKPRASRVDRPSEDLLAALKLVTSKLEVIQRLKSSDEGANALLFDYQQEQRRKS